jgi:hypothetical protein
MAKRGHKKLIGKTDRYKQRPFWFEIDLRKEIS